MPHHLRQIAVQQRLAAVEADQLDAAGARVVQQLARLLQAELLARHEVAPVAAPSAAQVAVRRHRHGQPPRTRAEHGREHPGDGVLGQFDADLRALQGLLEGGAAARDGTGHAAAGVGQARSERGRSAVARR